MNSPTDSYTAQPATLLTASSQAFSCVSVQRRQQQQTLMTSHAANNSATNSADCVCDVTSCRCHVTRGVACSSLSTNSSRLTETDTCRSSSSARESSSRSSDSAVGGGVVRTGDTAAPVTLKCVLLGDSGVGKTALVVSYTTNGFPNQHRPTTFDKYNVTVTVDNRPVTLQLCDTAGQRDSQLKRLREVWHDGAHVFLLCFSVVAPRSLNSLLQYWLPLLKHRHHHRHHDDEAVIVLVGTQSDLRSNVQVLIELSASKQQPVSEAEARKISAQHKMAGYVECSALTQAKLKDLFDLCIVSALNRCAKQATPPSTPRSTLIGPHADAVSQSETADRRAKIRNKRQLLSCCCCMR